MPIIINQVKSSLNAHKDAVVSRAIREAKLDNSQIKEATIHKTSLDARKRNDIHFVHSVFVTLNDDELERTLCEKNKSLTYVENSSFSPVISDKNIDGRIVIAGFGPAGMFCAMALAEQGYRPIVLERGEEIEKRTMTVKSFWDKGKLSTRSNVQFGEGGAGTFSDGKLTTRIKDPLCRYVLERFVEFGAPEEIRTKSKPHIGTDNLRNIVKAIRIRITELGGEVRFENQLMDFTVKNKRIDKVVTEKNEEKVSAVVIAIGHSARDTFKMLADKGVFLEPKPFSVGARIEHLQSRVDESLYGIHAGNPMLPQGEYQLSHRNRDGRGVYTFCMCPGGMVVASASEEHGIVTNGMSEFARDGKNANAALVVGVTPADFGSNALDGVDFARKIEQNAYIQTGSYKAAGTTVGGFLNGKPSLETSVAPTYSLGLTECDYTKIFPKFVTDMMAEGIHAFSGKMSCFGDKDAVLSAPETRTSSPVRITRNDELVSISLDNLYPCGEGAGYAGGIMSAAVDGLKTALKIMSVQKP